MKEDAVRTRRASLHVLGRAIVGALAIGQLTAFRLWAQTPVRAASLDTALQMVGDSRHLNGRMRTYGNATLVPLSATYRLTDCVNVQAASCGADLVSGVPPASVGYAYIQPQVDTLMCSAKLRVRWTVVPRTQQDKRQIEDLRRQAARLSQGGRPLPAQIQIALATAREWEIADSLRTVFERTDAFECDAAVVKEQRVAWRQSGGRATTTATASAAIPRSANGAAADNEFLRATGDAPPVQDTVRREQPNALLGLAEIFLRVAGRRNGGSSGSVSGSAAATAGSSDASGPLEQLDPSGSNLKYTGSHRAAVIQLLSHAPRPWRTPSCGNCTDGVPPVGEEQDNNVACERDTYVLMAVTQAWAVEGAVRLGAPQEADRYAEDMTANLDRANDLCGSGPQLAFGQRECTTLNIWACDGRRP